MWQRRCSPTLNVRVWTVDRDAVVGALRAWAQERSRDERVLAVVLFGSLARGDHTGASDADVLILLRASEHAFPRRIMDFIPVGVGVGVDVFPYTIEEAEASLNEGWGVVRTALAEGTILFERPGTLARLKRSATA